VSQVTCYASGALQVHVNGFVSLYSQSWPETWPPYPASYPFLYAYYSRWYAIVAPFWTDIELQDGVIYYGHISRYSDSEHVTPKAKEMYEATRQLVVIGAGDTGFLPTQVITVTWRNVTLSYWWWWWGWYYYYYYPYYWHGTQVRPTRFNDTNVTNNCCLFKLCVRNKKH